MRLCPKSIALTVLATIMLFGADTASVARSQAPAATASVKTNALWTKDSLGAKGEMAKLDFSRAGDSAPSIPFETREGRSVRLSDFKGRIVVVNLWATWCAPCITEMPHLAALQKAFPEKQLLVLPISMDMAGWRVIDAFWARARLANLTPYLDKSAKLTFAYKAQGLPLTIIYDSNGREVARLAAPARWDGPDARAVLQQLIDVKR